MLQNSFYAILGTFYTLLNNTDLYLSYFILSYVFLGHNDSVEWGLTVQKIWIFFSCHSVFTFLRTVLLSFWVTAHWESAEPMFCCEELTFLPYKYQNKSLTLSPDGKVQICCIVRIYTKGQIISEQKCGVLNFPKMQRN